MEWRSPRNRETKDAPGALSDRAHASRLLAALIGTVVLALGVPSTALAAGTIYWANARSNTTPISYANLDGSGGGNLDTAGATADRARGVAIILPPAGSTGPTKAATRRRLLRQPRWIGRRQPQHHRCDGERRRGRRDRCCRRQDLLGQQQRHDADLLCQPRRVGRGQPQHHRCNRGCPKRRGDRTHLGQDLLDQQGRRRRKRSDLLRQPQWVRRRGPGRRRCAVICR